MFSCPFRKYDVTYRLWTISSPRSYNTSFFQVRLLVETLLVPVTLFRGVTFPTKISLRWNPPLPIQDREDNTNQTVTSTDLSYTGTEYVTSFRVSTTLSKSDLPLDSLSEDTDGVLNFTLNFCYYKFYCSLEIFFQIVLYTFVSIFCITFL